MSSASRTPAAYDDDQKRVIESDAPMLVVKAFAGSGKTTTAVGYTDCRREDPTLYITFNKANQLEAEQRFGDHVEARTSHSLAYGKVGWRFADRLVRSWKPRMLAEEMGLGNMRTAAIVQAVLNRFFNSTDKDVLEQHVADVAPNWDLDGPQIGHIMDLAKKTWNSMRDLTSRTSVPPDAYLKMWALSKPVLKFPRIILDEAQDTNPVTAEVILAQRSRGTQMVYLGDPHQSIYAFRGATDFLSRATEMGAHVLPLRRTWRFGQKTADIANLLLGKLKGEDAEIIGMGQDRRRVSGDPLAILSRTNASLFGEAAQRRGQALHWVGGIENYRIDAVCDAFYISSNQRDQVRDAQMRKYASWHHFKDEAEATKDAEARILVKLVDQYGADIPSLVEELRARAVDDASRASTTLTTAHKSKGLDFPYVKLADDFDCIEDAEGELQKDGKLTQATSQEVNLLYVAITRAKHEVWLDKKTNDWVKENTRSYEMSGPSM